MVKINENYLLLQNSYLFVEVNRRAAKYMEENPDKNVIKMGIGDVTKPLVPTVIKAFKDAVDEMADGETFMGYGPEQGYDFLAEAIIKNDFNKWGVDLDLDEVFISDGAKCDTGNIQEIFALDNVIAVTDPVYPVYVNISSGQLVDETEKMPLTTSDTIVFEDVPSEVASNIHFTFDYPASHSVTSFEIKDLKGNFVPYSATYETESDENITKVVGGKNISYKRFTTTGKLQGEGTYKITLSKGLDE